LDLEWRGQKTVALADLRRALGASESYARYLAHGSVRKGWFERLRPGLFQLVPVRRLAADDLGVAALLTG
jgi:predicted transcriptional regulator of viral defense system